MTVVQTPAQAANRPADRVKHEGTVAAGSLFLVFAIAFGTALYQHLSGRQICVTFFGDSRHYLDTCRQLTAAVQSIFSGVPINAEAADALANATIMDGPILPLVPAVYFAAIGKLPLATDWQTFVVIGALYHAFGAVCVCILVRRLTGVMAATLCGLAWAIYPPAVIAAGRFLTEGAASFWLLILVWSCVNWIENGKNRRASARIGIILGVLALLKPAVLPAALLVGALTIMCGAWHHSYTLDQNVGPARRRAPIQRGHLAAAAIGALLVVAPWALFWHAATGKVCLIPQRAPVYNMAKGCDTEADGWGALPESKFVQFVANEAGAGQTLLDSWRMRPVEMANLTLRKTTRLFGMPWNDFRASVLFLDARLQWWWHAALLVLAALGGIALAGRLAADELSSQFRLVALATMSVVVAHLSYVPFEAISRYCYTAMPFLTIIAAYGVYTVALNPAARLAAAAFVTEGLVLAAFWQSVPIGVLVAGVADFRFFLSLVFGCFAILIGAMTLAGFSFATSTCKPRRGQIVAKLFGALLAVSCLAVIAAFCLDGREFQTYAANVPPGEAAGRQIRLALGAAPKSAWIAVDGAPDCTLCKLSVNGHQLVARPQLLFRIRPSQYLSCNIMRDFSACLDKPVEVIRQWRAVQVPAGWINIRGTNEITIAPAGPKSITIYSDYTDRLQSRWHLPLLNSFSGGMLCSEIDSLEARLRDPVGSAITGTSFRRSCAADATTTAKEILDRCQYRLCLLLGYGPGTADVLPASRTVQKLQKKLRCSDFDAVFGNAPFGADLCITRSALRAAAKTGCTIPLPEAFSTSRLIRCRLTGSIRATHGHSLASIVPIFHGAGPQPISVVSPATPPVLYATEEWRRFQIVDQVPAGGIPGGVGAVSIALYPGYWQETAEYGFVRRFGDTCVRDLMLTVEASDDTTLDADRVAVY